MLIGIVDAQDQVLQLLLLAHQLVEVGDPPIIQIYMYFLVNGICLSHLVYHALVNHNNDGAPCVGWFLSRSPGRGITHSVIPAMTWSSHSH